MNGPAQPVSGCLIKATLSRVDRPGERIFVMFNPAEYTVNRETNFAKTGVPGLAAPVVQFVHGQAQTLEMELFLDTYEVHHQGTSPLNKAGEDVRHFTEKVIGLMDIDPETHAPPVLLFTWASLSFTCVLERASQRFLMFLPDGTPVRARLQVTFSQWANVEMLAKATKTETADYTKVHVVTEGETLSAIAARTYGAPALWRPLALRNGVDRPRRLPVGLRLVVPPLPFQDPETGEVYQ